MTDKIVRLLDTDPPVAIVFHDNGDGTFSLQTYSSGGGGGGGGEVEGRGADGAAVVGKPVRIGGKDGSGNTQDVLTDAAGHLDVVGSLTIPGTVTIAGALDQGAAGAAAWPVVGDSAVVSVTPTVTASSAYAPGNVVGGKLTLAGALRLATKPALLQSMLVIDRSNQKAPLTVLLFKANPTDQTYTDKLAFPTLTSSTDAGHIIRKINIAAADYETVGGIAIATINPISKLVYADAGVDLWAVILTTGTPTFATTGALTVRFGFMRD